MMRHDTMAGAGAAALAVLCSIGWNRWRQRKEKSRREQELLGLITANTGKDLTQVRKVIVLPGGGPGGPEDYGMPAWTRQRTQAAAEAYAKCRGRASGDVLIYCTSAASMNAPQPRDKEGNIMFESTLMGQLLEHLGVPACDIVCDFIPWDTVANAWSVRLAITAIRRLSGHRKHPLDVEVFISDFHASRMEAALEWVLDLKPHPLLKSGDVKLNISSVPSGNTLAHNMSVEIAAEQIRSRIEHEEKGVLQLRRN